MKKLTFPMMIVVFTQKFINQDTLNNQIAQNNQSQFIC